MNNKTAKDWIDRAYSNLLRGKKTSYNLFKDIFLEDLCFDLQQCAEKSLKALLIHHNVDFPKTHDLTLLLKLIKNSINIEIPNEVYQSSFLTIYAVITRYPNWNKLSQRDYLEAVKTAEIVYNWAKDIIES